MAEILEDINTAVSMRYVVLLDSADLGSFTTCEGLGCEVVMETREEGGNNDFVWQLPTRLRYSNITLTRPLGPDTTKIAAWFAALATGHRPLTGMIEAQRADGTKIASWLLNDVVPVRWKGPSFDPDQPKVLVETLEIAHHGFAAEPGRKIPPPPQKLGRGIR
ncbi:phage tail protein [Kocuria flava]|uniref:phage tail protein n=1 Tax=Kocuria flava TaxID=446860 RepID=UPI001FF0E9D8|nr:phage tail protein [Kocuria flava]MCJ8505890.1 phage tail protein [Kocuria flava]